MRRPVSFAALFASFGLLAGCSSASSGLDDPGPQIRPVGGGATGGGSSVGGGMNLASGGGSAGSAGGPTGCSAGSGDPMLYDVPGNGIDDDCNGAVDDAPANCDGGSSDVGDPDPMNAARALGLCQVSNGSSWGVLQAKYVLADGSQVQTNVGHGLVSSFGSVNPQEGSRMLLLSSGTARRPGDPGFMQLTGGYHGPPGLDAQDHPTMEAYAEHSAMPNGFPYDPPACPGASGSGPAHDPAALELVIKAPSNAKGFKFKLDFYTFEYPMFICSEFNDFFVALQSPAPPNAVEGNISFDTQGNPVSVNNGFLQVCVPQVAGGKSFPCALGPGALAGTGFDDPEAGGPHAATGWLETVSPVTPGAEVTLRFAIWDVGDHELDSSVLIDDFEFIADDVDHPQTTPVPTPK